MSLESTILVRRVDGQHLAAVPHLHNSLSVKAKDMHDRHARFTRAHHKMRMDGHQVPVAQNIPDLKLLGREFQMVVHHCIPESLEAGGKERIVVCAVHVDMLFVCFGDLAGNYHLQEVNSGGLAGSDVVHGPM